MVGSLLAALPALAQREATRGALSRLEEALPRRLNDGATSLQALAPALVVSTLPAFEQTRAWYPAAALASLSRVLGPGALRACEACMAQRLLVEDGRLEQVASSLSLAELGRLDELTRGASAPAVSAIWLDETREGVALRIVDLRTGRVLLADNLDSRLEQQAASRERVTQAQEYERRSRGDALVHLFDDFGLLPQQHISFDFLEQWGPDNCNLSGFSLSLIDPLLGLGASYFRVIPPAFNLMVGAKLLVSLPNALVSVFAQNGLPPQFAGDGTFNGVFMVRVPLFKTNYGLMASVSTNGRVTVGLSLLNSSLLGLLP
ncbi:MAG: hypothetical protein INH41_14210 [Myxococcaceae bacterium]|nr:hypothetical protein [Myxococcaceae bacterium]MCA3013532.1 hypothetical protein [Myxococcaceae bacterium]